MAPPLASPASYRKRGICGCGETWPMRDCKPLCLVAGGGGGAARQPHRTCVVLPDPVSPMTTSTWLSRTSCTSFSRADQAGSCCRSASRRCLQRRRRWRRRRRAAWAGGGAQLTLPHPQTSRRAEGCAGARQCEGRGGQDWRRGLRAWQHMHASPLDRTTVWLRAARPSCRRFAGRGARSPHSGPLARPPNRYIMLWAAMPDLGSAVQAARRRLQRQRQHAGRPERGRPCSRSLASRPYKRC